MGIFDALTTAVAGLQAQSFALQNISGNIANSQTTAYKETDTSFADLVSAAAQSQQTADGVIASSVSPTRLAARSRAHRFRPTWRSTATAGSSWRSRRALPTISRLSPASSDLYARRQFSIERQWQSGQRRRLLSDGHSRSTRPPGIPKAASRKSCSLITISSRRRQPRRSRYQANLPSDADSGSSLSRAISPTTRLPGAEIVGSGATLDPDAAATGTGTVGNLTECHHADVAWAHLRRHDFGR